MTLTRTMVGGTNPIFKLNKKKQEGLDSGWKYYSQIVVVFDNIQLYVDNFVKGESTIYIDRGPQNKGS